MAEIKRGLGWLPDRKDERDFKFAPKAIHLPPKFDLRAGCPPHMDQGELGCHDDTTEVLTDRGWMLFSELDGGERLATINPQNEKLSFEAPTKILRFPYEGPMICGLHQNIDFCVTPNHRMLIRKWNESARTLDDQYQLIEASELGWYAGLMNRVQWDGESPCDTYQLSAVENASQQTKRRHKVARDIPMSAWLRFLGIYLAEGTMLRDKNHYGIQLAASKGREKDFIKNVLKELELHWLELEDRFTLHDQQVWKELERLGLFGVKAGKKFVPHFVFRQSASMIQEFLAGHFAGDGCEGNNRAHYTSSTALSADLQTLIFLSGNESFVSVRDARQSVMADGRTVIGVLPEHRISVCERKNLSIERTNHITSKHYLGDVFCAEVPSFHTLVTRRNGKILISGNSCTAHGTTGVVRYVLKQQGHADIDLSRLQLYWDTRFLEGTVSTDAGGEIRDAVKAAGATGIALEKLWPYNIDRFKQKPFARVYANALQFEALQYERVGPANGTTNIHAIKAAICSGHPVIGGFNVYKQFDSDQMARDGVVEMPHPGESPIGGHCTYFPAYGVKPGYITARNSYGPDFGDHGDIHLPEDYLVNEGDDYWVITKVGLKS